MRKVLLLSALMILLSSASLAQAPLLRGWDGLSEQAYQYVAFGTYPYEKDGASAPVLWRVLGPGTPGEEDVVGVYNVTSRKEVLPVTGDDFSGGNDDVFLLMTEYIIDFLPFHEKKDTEDGGALDYPDSLIRSTLNSDVIDRLFTKAEQSALVEMPKRGLLSLPSRKGELHREDYGFVNMDFTKSKTRLTTGTPYALAKGMRTISGHSWYFTTDWRRYGYRWIVGDDGHISVSGIDRQGGIRPVCYVHTDMLACLGGSGTMEDPFRLTVSQAASSEAAPVPEATVSEASPAQPGAVPVN